MKRLGMMVLTVAAVACFAGNASAQGRGGFGGPGMLLSNKGVQQELKADDTQVEKLNALATEVREKSQAAREQLQDVPQDERPAKMAELNRPIQAEMRKSLATILKPEQVKRFEQIQLQFQVQFGAQAFANPMVVDKLKISDEQKEKIKVISDEAMSQRREIMQGFQDDREGSMKKMADLNKETFGKIVALMSDDQKAAWKDLTGAPYEVKFEPPAGR